MRPPAPPPGRGIIMALLYAAPAWAVLVLAIWNLCP
jgi:hypothetical protein